MKSAVEIKNLEFRYAPKLPAVIVIKELKLEQGKSHLIYGESGCGKSTLLNLISGVVRSPKGATLRVMDTDLTNLSSSQCDQFRSTQMAFIFQQFNLIPYLTARDNIELPQRFRSHAPVSQSELDSIAERLQITPILSQKAVTLSHGQQQRVAAARALYHHASLVIADEPTSALDHANSEIFMKIMLDRVKKNKTTLVVVSHDLRYKKEFDNVIDFQKINQVTKTVR